MSRIRTIKPEFPQSESIGRLSRDARLLFVQIWTIVDDEGRARAASRMLASLLYPYDDDAPNLIEGWLGELERENCIRRYDVDGSRYLEIINWLKHQKIDHASKSRLPQFNEDARVIASPREPSRSLAPDLGPGPGPGSTLVGSGDPTPVIANDPFDRFWAVYPRRKGGSTKKTARKLFEAALGRRVDPEAIIAGARHYAEDMAADNKVGTVYVKDAETWLRKECWQRDDASASNVVRINPGVWADVDSPQWRAWDAHLKKKGRGAPQTDGRPDGPDGRIRRGWYFDSVLPPPDDQPAVAQPAADVVAAVPIAA